MFWKKQTIMLARCTAKRHKEVTGDSEDFEEQRRAVRQAQQPAADVVWKTDTDLL